MATGPGEEQKQERDRLRQFAMTEEVQHAQQEIAHWIQSHELSSRPEVAQALAPLAQKYFGKELSLIARSVLLSRYASSPELAYSAAAIAFAPESFMHPDMHPDSDFTHLIEEMHELDMIGHEIERTLDSNAAHADIDMHQRISDAAGILTEAVAKSSMSAEQKVSILEQLKNVLDETHSSELLTARKL